MLTDLLGFCSWDKGTTFVHTIEVVDVEFEWLLVQRTFFNNSFCQVNTGLMIFLDYIVSQRKEIGQKSVLLETIDGLSRK